MRAGAETRQDRGRIEWHRLKDAAGGRLESARL